MSPLATRPGAASATAISPSRQAVLDALSTVPGLTVSPTMPDTPTAGAAWPVWSESHYRDGKLTRPLTHTYEARVILPAGWLPETVDAADGLVEQIAGALSAIGLVDLVQPVSIQFDNAASMPGINARVTVVLR